MDLEILNSGRIADFYHIEEDVLGEGMNKVVRGLNIKTGEEVAIKIINTKEIGPEEQNYLFKEIQILSEVSHPNIVKLLEVFEDAKGGKFYLVFELMKGGTLSEKVAESSYMQEEKAANLLLPVVDALNFCHEIGITHRDLKPDNLLLDSNDPNASLKISDFGLASVTSEEEFMSTILGSKDFVAPEIVNEEKYSSKVDCWSMGVIIYYCLSGDLPFFYAKEEEKFEAIKKCKWEFSSTIWEDVSEEAKDLISKLLVRDPKKRLNCSEILEHEWFAKFT